MTTDGTGLTLATYVWDLGLDGGQEGSEFRGGQTGEELRGGQDGSEFRGGQTGAELRGGQTGEELRSGERGGLGASANLISMQRAGGDTRLHYDPLGNLAAAVDGGSGNLVEWYEYGDFGDPRVFDATSTLLAFSGIENPYVQQTLRYDAETRLLKRGGAMYEPSLARTTSRGGLWPGRGPLR